jgi:hypothetical protein
MAAARELVIADEPAAWTALGFATDGGGAFELGGVGVRLAGADAGSGILALRVDVLARERPDGLPLVEGGLAPLGRSSHPNGATAIDHVVALTDDRDRTTAALAAAGGDVRRRGEPPELPAPMAFVRFGELIVEVAQNLKRDSSASGSRLWGLTVIVPDVDALAGPLLGTPRAAVQPRRRIVTVGRAAGLSVALAFITPPRRIRTRSGRVAAFDNPEAVV